MAAVSFSLFPESVPPLKPGLDPPKYPEVLLNMAVTLSEGSGFGYLRMYLPNIQGNIHDVQRVLPLTYLRILKAYLEDVSGMS